MKSCLSITLSFDLKAIRLLSIRLSVPFDQMIIRPVDVLIKLNNERFEERGELSLDFTRCCFWILIACQCLWL